ncbi:MAG: PHP domain-containing protein [Burkholderiaceae bacterium]|nr:PHP domain-containing protein [Burkholderiaceae bacterium]
MHLLNADLHSHSTVSDGTLAPEALAARARAKGVALWSLTDHDSLAGQARAREAAIAQGIGYLSGIELSAGFIGRSVHVVGLGFDADDERLIEGVRSIREGRLGRARRIGEALAAAGLPGTYEGALRMAGDAELVARTHFARHLVEVGHFADVHEVFRHVLADGKPGHVPHTWATLREAVGWISAAGGIAVLAHPARYRFTPTEEYALFTEFTGVGGRGVEVLSGSHSVPEQVVYAEMALEFGLLASRGSDFHAPGESRTELGALPVLPGRLTPVWEALADRVQRG